MKIWHKNFKIKIQLKYNKSQIQKIEIYNKSQLLTAFIIYVYLVSLQPLTIAFNYSYCLLFKDSWNF